MTDTAPAIEAYSRADELRPGQGAPTYFLGLAWLRAGQPDRTLELWRQLLDEAPEDAEWRSGISARLARLELMLGLEQNSAPPESSR